MKGKLIFGQEHVPETSVGVVFALPYVGLQQTVDQREVAVLACVATGLGIGEQQRAKSKEQ